jgi:hypothetical protein
MDRVCMRHSLLAVWVDNKPVVDNNFKIIFFIYTLKLLYVIYSWIDHSIIKTQVGLSKMYNDSLHLSMFKLI